MAGIIQEIDLVLNRASLERLRQDFDKASQALGTGLAAGANPAAIEYSRKLVERLRTEFQQRSETLAKQLREGVLDVRQYNAAAERLGKEIIRDLNRGIKAGGALQLFEGEGGIALRNQLEAIGASARRAQGDIVRVPSAVTAVGRASSAATPGIGTLRSVLAQLAAQAAGLPGPLGRVASALLQFAGGGLVVVAVLAGLTLLAKAWEHFTSAAREAAKATKEALDDIEQRMRAAFERENPLAKRVEDLRKIRDELAKLERELGDARRGRGVFDPATGGITFKIDAGKVADLEKKIAALGEKAAFVNKEMTEALDAKKAEAMGSALEKPAKALADAAKAIIGTGTLNEEIVAQGAEAAVEAIKTVGELTAGVLTDITAGWRQQNAERLAQIAGEKSAEEQAIEQIEQANVDLHDLLAVHAEEDAARRKAAQIEQLAHLEAQAFEVERIVDNVLSIASAWGLVSEGTARALTALSQMATDAAGFAKSIASGDLIGALGSGVNVLGSLGSLLGESPEARALRESMEKNEQAIRDLSENIKQLDLTITGTGLLAAGRGLGGALGAGGIEQGVFPGLIGASGAASARADADALDRALRKAGSSLTELQDIANDLGIDIDELTRGQLTQLQRAIQEVDLTAFTRTLEGQLSVFQRFARQAGLTATETLTGIVGRARGTSEAFDKVFQGIDLSTKEGLEAAHERIVQALREVPLLTAEQLGDLSVEGYLALLDEAGGLVSQGLDDLGQAILDAAREAEEAAQEAADLSRRRIGSRRDINELLDRTDPLDIIKGIAGGVPKILQDALAGLDLTREADRDRLDALIQSLFAQLSTGQLERGGLLEGMAPEDFRNLLLEWERLLDEQRQNEADAAERAANEAEQRQRDRERAAEEARREAERLEREREQRERDRLEAKRDAEQLLVDERLALEEQAELRDLEKRARLLGGDPVRAIREALQLFAEAERLAGGELGAESPLARDARRRALEAQREAERQIEAGERLIGGTITPGFTVQRTITEASSGRLISEIQLQTNWLQRMHVLLGSIDAKVGGVPVVNVTATGGTSVEVSRDISRDLAAEFQRAALLSGNAEMR